MAATTVVNGRTVVHKGSGGLSTAFPDVCLTPLPGGVAPVPYPNVARSADLVRGSRTVRVDGQPVALKDSAFGRSTGDEPGVRKGVISQEVMGEARFQNYSFDVKIEGRNACRLLDPMANNAGSPPNTGPVPEAQAGRAAGPPRGQVLIAGHVVRVTVRYAHPKVWTDQDQPPRFGVGYELDGPEHETWSSLTEYTTGVSNVWHPGRYRLSLKPFDRERRALLPADRLAQLAARARPVLQRAADLIENTREDLSEVAGRLSSDLRDIAADTTGAVRARLQALDAQIDASLAEIRAAQADLDRAIRQADSDGWGTAARSAAAAARRGAQAVSDALGEVADAADGLSGEGQAAWDRAGRALSDASVGLNQAAQDVEEAVFSFDK